MKKIFLLTVLTTVVALVFFPGCQVKEEPGESFAQRGSYQGEYWPTSGWRTCAPEETGMDSLRLKALYDYLARAEFKTDGVVVVHKGYIVAEAYFGNFKQNSPHQSYSVAKSVTGALIGVAAANGLITGVQQRAADFFPQWRAPGTHAWKQAVTVRDLLTMTSGLSWNETDYFGSGSALNDAYLMANQHDFVRYVLDKTAVNAPGTVWNYSSGDSVLLAGIVARASGLSARDYAQQHIFSPMGVSALQWESDNAGNTNGGWGIHLTVRDFAKFGLLYLKKGRWGNQQLVPAAWVEESVRRANPDVPHYGFQWWRAEGLKGFAGSRTPADTFIAVGLYRQYIVVTPSLELVVARFANDPDSTSWNTIQFIQLATDAVP